MERMEVDQCAGAAGGALRRSNSAPMITSVSDGMAMFSPVSSARYRRSSVSINPSGPSQLVPLSPSSATRDHKRQEENMETILRGSLQRLSASSLNPVHPASQWHNPTSVVSISKPLPPPGVPIEGLTAWSQDSGVTPSSSPSPPRRFRPAGGATVRSPVMTPLKRKGGVESDGPPKKLFVAGVTDPAQRSSSYTFSVSQSAADSPPAGGVSPQSLSPPPPSFTAFASHQHPRH